MLVLYFGQKYVDLGIFGLVFHALGSLLPVKENHILCFNIPFGVEDLDENAHSPDLNLIQHLWDELRCRLTNNTTVTDLCNCG